MCTAIIYHTCSESTLLCINQKCNDAFGLNSCLGQAFAGHHVSKHLGKKSGKVIEGGYQKNPVNRAK